MNTLVQQLASLSSGPDVLKFLGVTHEESELNGCDEYLLQQFYQHIQHERNFEVSNESEMFRKMRELLMKVRDK